MKVPAQDDPMELVGMGFPEGDMETMVRCIVEEYLLIGWNERQIMLLFTRPCFRATHRICRAKGEGWVRARVEEICREWSTPATGEEASHA